MICHGVQWQGVYHQTAGTTVPCWYLLTKRHKLIGYSLALILQRKQKITFFSPCYELSVTAGFCIFRHSFGDSQDNCNPPSQMDYAWKRHIKKNAICLSTRTYSWFPLSVSNTEKYRELSVCRSPGNVEVQKITCTSSGSTANLLIFTFLWDHLLWVWSG